MHAKDERICVIGGGPAGLAAAYFLQKKGYHDYTVLEANDRVGGKTYSPKLRGKSIEMGAIMGVPNYDTVKELGAAAGVPEGGPESLAHTDFRRPDGKLYRPFTGLNLWKGARLMYQLDKLDRILKSRYPGYDANGHYGTFYPDLALPLSSFFEKNGVAALTDLYAQPFTSFGYGYFEVIPAAYVLKYLDIPTAKAFVANDLWTWEDGTQSIFEGLDKVLEHPAVLNSPATAVVRDQDGVHVTTPAGTQTYDQLIVTTPLEQFAEFADADQDERTEFAKILHNDYVTHAIMVRNLPKQSSFIPDNMTGDRLGHPMVFYVRYLGEPDQPIVTYALRNYPGKPALSVEETRETVLADLKSWGFWVDEVLDEQSWYYFPHVSSEDYGAGWYTKVEGMQGRRRTYYAGEVMSFGDMDETTNYSRGIVDRFFG